MSTDFSAKEPALGYAYQIRYALLALLRASKSQGNCEIILEGLDDIELRGGDSTQLIQSKLHINPTNNLTERSPDFWKTIRVWSEAIVDGKLMLDETVFMLVTSEAVPEDSLLASFVANRKKAKDLITALLEIAAETSNQTNIKGYQAFLKLEEAQRKSLLSKIVIADGSIDIEEVRSQTMYELKFSTHPGRVERLFEALEGWWVNQSLLNLLDKVPSISSTDLHRQICSIADTLTIENLPLDFPKPIDMSDEEVGKANSYTFVKQLAIVGLGANTIRNSISDFHRAHNQRSKWIREDLLNPLEETAFEDSLLDDWALKYGIVCDESVSKTDSEKQSIGKDFVINFYLKNYPLIFIRPKFQHGFLTRGSCHILANRKLMGWHPNFQTLIPD